MTEKEWRMFQDSSGNLLCRKPGDVWRKMFKTDPYIDSIYAGLFFSDR